MIKTRNYVANTLRRDRADAFQHDLAEVLELFEQHRTPSLVKAKQFIYIWHKCNMHYIFQCLGDEEDEEQFAQLLYEVTLKKYFFNRPKNEKIFALFCLYCEYFACERRKKISISKPYVDEIIQLMRENKLESKNDYFRVIRYLHENCFSYSVKVGLKAILLKPNGELSKKPPVISIDHTEYINSLKYEMSDLSSILNDYHQLKQESKNLGIKTNKLKTADVHFSHRVDELVREYERDIAVPHNEMRDA